MCVFPVDGNGPQDFPNPNQPKIDAESGEIEGALVFLRKVDLAVSKPWSHAPVSVVFTDTALEVRQGAAPVSIGIVQLGDTVACSATVERNFVLVFRGVDFFSMPLPKPNLVTTRKLAKPGAVELSCGRGRYWLHDYLWVSDHPYVTKTKADGSFELKRVPVGDYELVAWMPNWHFRSGRNPETGEINRLEFEPPVEKNARRDRDAPATRPRRSFPGRTATSDLAKTTDAMSNPFRQLPSVSDLLQHPSLAAATHDRGLIADALRDEIDLLRERLAPRRTDRWRRFARCDRPARALRVASGSRTCGRDLRRVINATGIVLHTNLGRAPIAEEAARAAYEAARGYLNLELDLDTGKRSSRQTPIREWICRLTGAESATAVNNNAAATVIALARSLRRQGGDRLARPAHRDRRQLPHSRNHGRQRGPARRGRHDQHHPARATTSGPSRRRRPPSCGSIRATTASAASPSRRRSPISSPSATSTASPVIDDIGSGALVDFGRFGFTDEPIAADSIRAGADVVLFSGDKLLGGPQAGILAGKKTWIDRIEKDPLMRAFRLDKMTLAALEATLRLYVRGKAVPVLELLALSLGELQRRAETLAGRLAAARRHRRRRGDSRRGVRRRRLAAGPGARDVGRVAPRGPAWRRRFRAAAANRRAGGAGPDARRQIAPRHANRVLRR